jgi:23S rRNA pseudouridine1911/1915/1917 synthase
VSGVVLFARQTVSAQRLSAQFQSRQVAKTYWGVVEGVVQPPAGQWQDWLRKVHDEARVEIVEEGTPDARLAQMDYQCLQPCDGGTLVEFRPETGRMHQIRVQAAARGWPIRGDWLYGARLPFGPETALPRDRVIALHARTLTFLHPIRFEPITVTAPLPEHWQ